MTHFCDRLGRAYPFDARPAEGPDGEVFESAGYVRYEGLQEKCYGWYVADEEPDDICEQPKVAFIRCHYFLTMILGCAAYGNDGSTVELSPWQAYNAASFRNQ